MTSHETIAVIGLGYVGLPLAVELGKITPTVGFDIDTSRIEDLRAGVDRTLEVTKEQLLAADQLSFTDEVAELARCNFYIVTVPTPIDKHNRPDLGPLKSATELIACYLQAGDVVVYESTVFPGATEEVCVPLLAQGSGLTFNKDFFCGYSPERINPGDKKHAITSIQKVTSGSTPEAAERIDALYKRIITAGTYKASSIKVAEAAKVIENTQRDVNIALINELALIFEKCNIDTEEVLQAAETKWNFLPFRPGLVGGHCIGVDPYYLTQKALEVGHNPEMILAGRRINDQMGDYVAGQVMKLMTHRNIALPGSKVLVLGVTFKENCPDFRNTRVISLVRELQSYRCEVDVYDPWVDAREVEAAYQIKPLKSPQTGAYDAIVLAVAHDQFKEMGADQLRRFGKGSHVLYDVKYALPADLVDGRL